MPSNKIRLDTRVQLPSGLTPKMARTAAGQIEQRASDLVELYNEQRNAFSTIVGIFGARALAAISPYEPSPHRFEAQGAFPDLRKRGSRGSPPPPRSCLESKGSTRPWVIQAHYDHEGWYIVWRYLVDDSETISGRPVVVWRVDVVYLTKDDWKYETSTASASGGGRTHTFGVQQPARKLAEAAVYRRTDIKLVGGKPVPTD